MFKIKALQNSLLKMVLVDVLTIELFKNNGLVTFEGRSSIACTTASFKLSQVPDFSMVISVGYWEFMAVLDKLSLQGVENIDLFENDYHLTISHDSGKPFNIHRVAEDNINDFSHCIDNVLNESNQLRINGDIFKAALETSSKVAATSDVRYMLNSVNWLTNSSGIRLTGSNGVSLATVFIGNDDCTVEKINTFQIHAKSVKIIIKALGNYKGDVSIHLINDLLTLDFKGITLTVKVDIEARYPNFEQVLVSECENIDEDQKVTVNRKEFLRVATGIKRQLNDKPSFIRLSHASSVLRIENVKDSALLAELETTTDKPKHLINITNAFDLCVDIEPLTRVIKATGASVKSFKIQREPNKMRFTYTRFAGKMAVNLIIMGITINKINKK